MRTHPLGRRRRLSPALLGAVVALVLAEVAVRGLVAVGLLVHAPGWLSDEYPAKVAAMERLADDGGAGVAVLGSSVADTGVDPAGLGPAATGGRGAYNAALLGPTPPIVDDWSAGWVEPLLTPDTAVVVVSSRDLNANAPHLREAEREWREGLWVRHRLGRASPVERLGHWITERSALVRYRTRLHRPVASILKAAPPQLSEHGQETHVVDEGYRIGLFLDNLLAPGSTANAWRDFRLDEGRLSALRRLARRLADDGVRVVLVDAPVTADYPPLHPGGADDYRDYRATLTDLATEVGAELVVPGLWDPALFADPIHVNGAGAERLTALLDAVLAHEPTTDGGRVDLATVPGAAALVGPADPDDPAVPGPAVIPPEGPGALDPDDLPVPVEAG